LKKLNKLPELDPWNEYDYHQLQVIISS
jgi:hypothetical protein